MFADSSFAQEVDSTGAAEVGRVAPAVGSDSAAKEPIQFTAGDSLIVSVGSGDQRGALFGNAMVKMTSTQLEAYRIDILFDIDELRAEPGQYETCNWYAGHLALNQERVVRREDGRQDDAV